MSSLLCTLKQQIFTIVFTGFDLVKDRFLILLSYTHRSSRTLKELHVVVKFGKVGTKGWYDP